GDVCDIDRLILPEDRGAVIDEVKTAAGEGRPFLVEYRIARKDGGIRYLQERGRPVRGADGKPFYIDGVILDITGRMKAQRDREEMLARLNDAQKMEAVGTLAGGIAHDFNNLLTVIRGDTELALEITGEQGEAYSCLRQVKKAADRAAELTRKLLLFSRNRHITPVDMDLNATVTEMVKMLNRLIGDNISVSVDLEPGPWTVHAEPSGMEQVIMNLVLNARDAMPDGGIISVSTRNVEITEGGETGDGGRLGQFVRLSVSDNGCGMDEDTMKHIFDPFFSRSQGKGTGLGLTVVYGVVKGLGGWVSVDSGPGNGARFDVYLERAETG
ncbi:MAG TPA: ATP-binding protein, partial [Nitrospirota bacterium]